MGGYKQILDAFSDVKSFLEDESHPSSRTHLLEILNDLPSYRKLNMEIASTVDAGEPFVKATYQLEGDGPLVFLAYEEIRTLFSTIAHPFYPNVSAVAGHLTGGVVSLVNQVIKLCQGMCEAST